MVIKELFYRTYRVLIVAVLFIVGPVAIDGLLHTVFGAVTTDEFVIVAEGGAVTTDGLLHETLGAVTIDDGGGVTTEGGAVTIDGMNVTTADGAVTIDELAPTLAGITTGGE